MKFDEARVPGEVAAVDILTTKDNVAGCLIDVPHNAQVIPSLQEASCAMPTGVRKAHGNKTSIPAIK